MTRNYNTINVTAIERLPCRKALRPLKLVAWLTPQHPLYHVNNYANNLALKGTKTIQILIPQKKGKRQEEKLTSACAI